MAVADSPVMQQYKRLKAEHGDALMLFRMGDFYEMFGEDAMTASGLLQLTLTRRRTAQAGDEGVPMCGMPYHAAEGYIGKLLEAGYRVALAEQVETPEEAKKARGSGALVKRDIVRLYTPGTLTEDAFLPMTAPKYLVAVAEEAKSSPWRGAVAWLDLAGGSVGVRLVGEATLASVLAGLPVGELLVPENLLSTVTGMLQPQQLRVDDGVFASGRADAALARAYGVAQMNGLGLPEGAATTAVGALLAYAEVTQVGKLPALQVPQVVTGRSVMAMDPMTRRNLELTESLAGKRADSLLGVLDQTVTGAGARLLYRWVNEPLTEVAQINLRQRAVAALVADGARRKAVRELLQETGDVARCVSRLLLGRGGPRDLDVLRQTGLRLPKLATVLREIGAASGADFIAKQAKGMDTLQALTGLLDSALAEPPLPLLLREGGFIREGFDKPLDESRDLVAHGNERLQQLEQAEALASGIAGLKLRYNKVWGYYFELTKAQAGKVPGHFIHRQTTTGTHRYSTEKLMVLERDLGGADAAATAREQELFGLLGEAVQKASYGLLAAAEALATVDALAGLAEVAARHVWVAPTVDDSNAFKIRGGKHPVVAARVSDFVPNNADLTGGALWLLTGPNMAGKSTFLRQNALLVILSQMGSFVPAEAAHIGVADAVFSRIGAADNLAAGQSTFMVEMVETAQILNRATHRSLVILDELGRGTATYDGLAIAWACVEDIANRIGCRTLFATHYHELTTLADSLAAVSVHQMAVKEWQGDIVFLHQVKPGAAAGSFGVQVAKLAGVPVPVVKRAQVLLDSFLKTAQGNAKSGVGVAKISDLGLFAAPVAPVTTLKESVIETGLKELDVDGMSPREALDALYRLRSLLNG